MICDLITDRTFVDNVVCSSWEQLVDISGNLLVAQGSVEPQFLQSVKDTIVRYGAYMVLVDDIAFFHGRPDAGVHEVAMSLALLREPVYIGSKRILAAFMFSAVDTGSHLELLRELSGYLQDDDFLTLLRTHGSKTSIMEKLRKGAKTE